MFCSNCGKTLKSDDTGCPHCGAVVGESRFEGNPYTGAQAKTRPGEAVRVPVKEERSPGNHTRTVYMGSENSEDSEVDARTTYRATGESVPSYEPERPREPLYDEMADNADPFVEPDYYDSASESDFDMPNEEDIAPEASEGENEEEPMAYEPNTDPEDESALEELSAREIKIERRAGISDDVSRYMNELRNSVEKPKKHEKRKHRKEAFSIDEETDSSNEPDETDIQAEEAFDTEAEETEFSDLIEEEMLSDEELDEEIDFSPRRKIPGAVKYIAAALVIVLVLIGAIVGISYITDKTKVSPINGVSLELYEAGVELMTNRVGDDYQRSVHSMYSNEASKVNIAAKLTADMDEIEKALPDAVQANDPMFIETLRSIQKNINNTIFNDINARSDTNASNEAKAKAAAQSAENWAYVRGLVSSLENATSTAQLDAIMKGEQVIVVDTKQPEPSDNPAPTYTTLAKGSSGEAVTNLQKRLTELGYLSDTIDGKFGNNTKTAVQLFQQASGLEATGIADEQTQIALYSLDAVPYEK